MFDSGYQWPFFEEAPLAGLPQKTRGLQRSPRLKAVLLTDFVGRLL